MTQKHKIITILGGAGFVGRYIIRDLAKQGFRIRAIVRDTQEASFLKTMGDVGQIALIYGDINEPESYKDALDDCYGVINLVGVLYEKGEQTFSHVHAQGPEKLAQRAQKAGVKRFVHMSALGAERAVTSKYAKTKLAGEKAVRAAFPNATIMRPSVVFGEEDNFYNQFACMSRFAPALPLIGGGKTKFQPVFVADVAHAFVTALRDDSCQGNIYELGGPEVLSFKDILEAIKRYTHRSNMLITVPTTMMRIGASFAQFLPTPPITPDQVELLQYDNIVSDDAYGFAALGITPKHPDTIVPHYLERFALDTPQKHSA